MGICRAFLEIFLAEGPEFQLGMLILRQKYIPFLKEKSKIFFLCHQINICKSLVRFLIKFLPPVGGGKRLSPFTNTFLNRLTLFTQEKYR
jgi:hypothetical protein